MAKKKSTKPTVEEIKSRYEAYKSHYSTLHSQQEEIDDYYELDFDAGVPISYEKRMPPTARKWIDVGVTHFTLDNPKSRVPLRGDNETARNQVALLEAAYNFWLRLESQKGTIKRSARKLLKRGEIFLKVNMDDTYFGSQSEERLFYWPLFLTVPDPINVYCSPAHNGLVPNDVIESFNITVAEAKAIADANEWKWTTSESPNATVPWFSYISHQWRYFEIAEEPVLKVQPNIFGFCPYVHGDAGFGDENYEGKPEYLYRSILWQLRDMLKMEVRNLSQTDAILSRYAWPRRKIKGSSATGISDAIKQLYPDGNIPTDPEKFLYEVLGQFELEIEEGAEPPPALFTQQALMRDYSNPPTVLSGVRPTGVYSGQHQEDLMMTAKSTYKDSFKNLENVLGVAMGMGARILDKVYNSELQIRNFSSDEGKSYLKIKPSDIKGHYDCEVQLLAEPPEANEMRKGLGKAYWQGGAISQETMLKDYFDMSQKEAQDEMARILAETAIKQPGMMAVATADAMKQFGMDKELEELQAAEQMGIKGRPPLNVGENTNLPPAGRPGTQASLIPNPTRQEQRI